MIKNYFKSHLVKPCEGFRTSCLSDIRKVQEIRNKNFEMKWKIPCSSFLYATLQRKEKQRKARSNNHCEG